MMFSYKHKDKEDIFLSPEDMAAYTKSAKASFQASQKLAKIGVGAKNIEAFKLAWKYRNK
jgi:hypothetical protein